MGLMHDLIFGGSGMVTKEQALPGRSNPLETASHHAVSGASLSPPWPVGTQEVVLGMGCFWGTERLFWPIAGVVATSAGYGGGFTPNPTYDEVCSGRTGHAEVVRIVYDPHAVSFEALLKVFYENHDPTQGNRQGNDTGSQYRSLIGGTTPEQHAVALRVTADYQEALTKAGKGEITTQVVDSPDFYMAEEYHQQYLYKNPGGYCNHHFNGVSCSVGIVSR